MVRAEHVFQQRARRRAAEAGAHLISPESVYFSFDTYLAKDTTIEPYVVFGLGVSVGTGARIRSFSHLEGCEVSAGATVGPYARLRPGTLIESGARVGNFVEVKASRIGEGAKVPHLSYIGDADVGRGSNIGAGSITCNYDGRAKHRTSIGDRAFIGSNTVMVAPVEVGDASMTAAGSVITSDVAEGDLAFARSQQVNRPGMAERLLARTSPERKGK